MNKLRIGLVSYEFPPLHGGEGTYTYNLMKALERIGSDVVLITPSQATKREDESDHNITSPIIYVNPIKMPGLRTLTFGLIVRKNIGELCKRYRLDIIHYTNDYCDFLTSKMEVGIPTVATIHHVHAYELRCVLQYLQEQPLRRLYYLLEQNLINVIERNNLFKADRVVAVSKFTAENAVSYHHIPRSKISVVLNAVDSDRFNPNVDWREFRSYCDISAEPLVLYVGRLARNKGLLFLIEAFSQVVKQIQDAKLIIAGEGRLGESDILRSYINKFKIQSSVRLIGRVSERELPYVYSAANVVVLPSLHEGFGLSLLESMATGKPVVATKVGPIPELVVHDQTGILVPPADSRALADAIIETLSNEVLARRLGDAGRRRVEEQFTLNIWAKQMFATYEDALKIG